MPSSTHVTSQRNSSASTSSNSASDSPPSSPAPLPQPSTSTSTYSSNPSSPIFSHKPLSRASTDPCNHQPVSIVLARSGTSPESEALEGPRILTCGTPANREVSHVLGLFSGGEAEAEVGVTAAREGGNFVPGKRPLVLTAELYFPASASASTVAGEGSGELQDPQKQMLKLEDGDKNANAGTNAGDKLRLGAVLDHPGRKIGELEMKRGDVWDRWQQRVRAGSDLEKMAAEEKEERAERGREDERGGAGAGAGAACSMPGVAWSRLN